MRRKHHQLVAWQAAVMLVKKIYESTQSFPQNEIYGLTSQMRRAAVSVPANIAERAARTSTKEFVQFLSIARGSLSELDTYVVISKELGYLSEIAEIEALIDRVFALVGGLINSERRVTAK